MGRERHGKREEGGRAEGGGSTGTARGRTLAARCGLRNLILGQMSAAWSEGRPEDEAAAGRPAAAAACGAPPPMTHGARRAAAPVRGGGPATRGRPSVAEAPGAPDVCAPAPRGGGAACGIGRGGRAACGIGQGGCTRRGVRAGGALSGCWVNWQPARALCGVAAVRVGSRDPGRNRRHLPISRVACCCALPPLVPLPSLSAARPPAGRSLPAALRPSPPACAAPRLPPGSSGYSQWLKAQRKYIYASIVLPTGDKCMPLRYVRRHVGEIGPRAVGGAGPDPQPMAPCAGSRPTCGGPRRGATACGRSPQRPAPGPAAAPHCMPSHVGIAAGIVVGIAAGIAASPWW